MFVTNWISTTKIQKISEITNFFRHYFLSRTEVYLAYKAFYPAKIPFPLLHIDTGHNFEETIQYRDELAKKLGAELIVGSVQESIDKGRVKEETGYYASRNKLQTTTLLDTLEEYKFDAAIGGARRDEEKARAKERFFSHRDEFGQWNPNYLHRTHGIKSNNRSGYHRRDCFYTRY